MSTPALPGFLEEITIRRLRVRDASVDLSLTQKGKHVGLNILRKEGASEVVVSK